MKSACENCLIPQYCMAHGMLGITPKECESQVPRNGALEISDEVRLEERTKCPSRSCNSMKKDS
jgi:hypothetical protein